MSRKRGGNVKGGLSVQELKAMTAARIAQTQTVEQFHYQQHQFRDEQRGYATTLPSGQLDVGPGNAFSVNASLERQANLMSLRASNNSPTNFLGGGLNSQLVQDEYLDQMQPHHRVSAGLAQGHLGISPLGLPLQHQLQQQQQQIQQLQQLQQLQKLQQQQQQLQQQSLFPGGLPLPLPLSLQQQQHQFSGLPPQFPQQMQLQQQQQQQMSRGMNNRVAPSQSSHGETSGDSDLYSISSHKGASLSGTSTPDSEDTYMDDNLNSNFSSLALGMNMGPGGMGLDAAGARGMGMYPQHPQQHPRGNSPTGMNANVNGVNMNSIYRHQQQQQQGHMSQAQMNHASLAQQMNQLGVAMGQGDFPPGYRMPGNVPVPLRSMNGMNGMSAMNALNAMNAINAMSGGLGAGMNGMPGMGGGIAASSAAFDDSLGGMGGLDMFAGGQDSVLSSLGLDDGDDLGSLMSASAHLSKPVESISGPFYSDKTVRQQYASLPSAMGGGPGTPSLSSNGAQRSSPSQSPLSFLMSQASMPLSRQMEHLAGKENEIGSISNDVGLGGGDDIRLSLSSSGSSQSAQSNIVMPLSRSRGNSLSDGIHTTSSTPPLPGASAVPASPKSFRHKSQLPIPCPTPLRARSMSDSNSLALEMAESVLDGLAGTPTSNPGTPRHLHSSKGAFMSSVQDGVAGVGAGGRRRTGSTDSDLKRMNSKDSMSSMLSASSDNVAELAGGGGVKRG